MLISGKISVPNRQAISRHKRALSEMTDLIDEIVHIPGTDAQLTISRPVNIDSVLDAVIDDPEQNLPYWAEIWPSGIALASEILQRPEIVRGFPVLELGCGIGITAAAAIFSGAQLTATDYSPHSLRLTELTCLQAGVEPPVTRQVNWRKPQADLLQQSGDRWPVVLAADVLYEERDVEPMLSVLERITASGGVILLAEPGRRHAKTALRMARDRGWSIETRTYTGPWPDDEDKSTIVSVHTIKP